MACVGIGQCEHPIGGTDGLFPGTLFGGPTEDGLLTALAGSLMVSLACFNNVRLLGTRRSSCGPAEADF